MRAEIEIREVRNEKLKEKGLFASMRGTEYFTTWDVYPNIQLTNEEKQALTKFNLWERVALSRPYARAMYDTLPSWAQSAAADGSQIDNYSITRLVQPNFCIKCYDPLEAKNLQHEFETTILPNLKAAITNNASPTSKRIVDL